MKIGIDCLSLQSKVSRLRGIGRYGQGLLAALLAAAPDDQFVLYMRTGLPSGHIPIAPNTIQRPVSGHGRSGGGSIEPWIHRNPDKLDAMVFLSPHEDHIAGTCKIPLRAAVIFDLIPQRLPEQYLRLESYRRDYEEYLEGIKPYDLFLSISEATRRDFIDIRGFPAERIVTIGGAVDPKEFRPLDGPAPLPDSLTRLGVRAPYILHVGGEDARKGGLELIAAFGGIPVRVREPYQLVFAYDQSLYHQFNLNKAASQATVGSGRFLATGEVSNETLVELYRHAAATVFPSTAEGLGLPLLESMACGLPTIGGRNTSQIEIIEGGGQTDGHVGDRAGILVETGEGPERCVRELQEALTVLLSDPETARRIGAAGLERSKMFRWEAVAGRAMAALRGESVPPPVWVARDENVGKLDVVERTPDLLDFSIKLTTPPEPDWSGSISRPPKEERGEPGPDVRTPTGKPRLALFGPVPPVLSGVAPYTVELARALAAHYEVTIFYDLADRESYPAPPIFPGGHPVGLQPASAFDPVRWRLRCYQMGNSHYHAYMVPWIKAAPGVVTLHDLTLGGLDSWLKQQGQVPGGPGGRPPGWLTGAPLPPADPLSADMLKWCCAYATRLVVHSTYGLGQLWHSERAERAALSLTREEFARVLNQTADRGVVIPFGAAPNVLTAGQRLTVRVAYSLPRGPLAVIGGIVHSTKLVTDALSAWAAIRAQAPNWSLAIVGLEADNGEARRFAERLGLPVTWTGKLPAAEFADVMACADLAINLRRPPTNGETSASLTDALRGGVASIVSDVGSFACMPAGVVRKVPAGDQAGLVGALLELTTSDRLRKDLAAAGLDWIKRECGWGKVAERYRGVIG